MKPKMLLKIHNWLSIRLLIRPPITACPLIPHSAMDNANVSTLSRPKTQHDVALAKRMMLAMEREDLNKPPLLELPAGSSIPDDIFTAARLVLCVDKVCSMQKETLSRIFYVKYTL